MAPGFLLGLREGIEAALIVSIVLAFLARTGNRRHFGPVWLGVALAVGFSLAVGAVLFYSGTELEGQAEQIFEGSAMVLAVLVLTWMIFWMRRQAAGIRRSLESQVGDALAGGSTVALVALAFVAVGREGVEVSLFLLGAAATGGTIPTLLGGFLGLAAAAGVGYGLYRGSGWFDLRTFFRVSGLLLIVFAAGLLSQGVHEFAEAGFLPETPRLWDLSAVLSHKEGLGLWLRTLFGYSATMTALEFAAWFGYLVVTLAAFLRPSRRVAVPASGEPAVEAA